MSRDDTDRPAAPGLWVGFRRRLLGALQLQPEVYDDIASHPEATQQAVLVVAGCSLAQALAGPEPIPPADLPLALAWGYAGWLLPGTVVWFASTRWLGMAAALPRLLRCLGFATAPQLLWVLGQAAPHSMPFQLALGVVIFVLALAANVVAIRQAFAVSTLRAVQSFALGFLVFALVAVAIGVAVAPFGGEA